MRKKHVHIVTEHEAAAFRVFWGRLGMQAAIMESQGYSDKQINRYLAEVCTSLGRRGLNEGMFDDLGGTVEWLSNNGMFQGLQKMAAGAIATPLAATLGIPTDGFAYKLFVNFLENLDAATFKQVLGGDYCKPLATKFAGAFQESIAETVAQQLDIGQGLFGGAVREGLQAAFVEGGPFVNAFANAMCTFDFKSILPGMGDEKAIAEKAAAAQGTKVPPAAAAELAKAAEPKQAAGAAPTPATK
jgi:hypothetical protein